MSPNKSGNSLTQEIQNYIYTFKFDRHHNDLCKLESRQLFGIEEQNRQLMSTIKIDPSISSFIKNRFDIIFCTATYSDLLYLIKQKKIVVDGFKVEYISLHGDTTEYPERLSKLKDVGYSIEGEPEYYKPLIIYSICNLDGLWYFGTLEKHNKDWFKHKQKPCSFSNSIDMNIAKTLVSVASKGDKNNTLIDSCCGVGTVLLEACITGFNIEGCDINEKNYLNTKKNLEHYNYQAQVHHSDIKDIDNKYDASIIDLPYNLYAHSSDEIVQNIITSSAKLTSRLIIVSISDIKDMIHKAGLEITDTCTVEKKGKSKFARTIWVCETNL